MWASQKEEVGKQEKSACDLSKRRIPKCTNKSIRASLFAIWCVCIQLSGKLPCPSIHAIDQLPLTEFKNRPFQFMRIIITSFFLYVRAKFERRSTFPSAVHPETGLISSANRFEHAGKTMVSGDRLQKVNWVYVGRWPLRCPVRGGDGKPVHWSTPIK